MARRILFTSLESRRALSDCRLTSRWSAERDNRGGLDVTDLDCGGGVRLLPETCPIEGSPGLSKLFPELLVSRGPIRMSIPTEIE